jgi:hypothetical protein
MSTYSKIIVGLLGLSAATATAVLIITLVNEYEQTLVPFYIGGIILSVTLAAARILSDPSRRNKDRIVRKGGAPVIEERNDDTKYVPQG